MDSLSSAHLVLGRRGKVVDNKKFKVFERPCAKMAEEAVPAPKGFPILGGPSPGVGPSPRVWVVPSPGGP